MFLLPSNPPSPTDGARQCGPIVLASAAHLFSNLLQPFSLAMIMSLAVHCVFAHRIIAPNSLIVIPLVFTRNSNALDGDGLEVRAP